MSQDISQDTFDLDDLEALGLSKFDPTQHLTSKEAVAAYMSEIVATGNADLFQSAMNDVVRAVRHCCRACGGYAGQSGPRR